jgi:hypothetical protein
MSASLVKKSGKVQRLAARKAREKRENRLWIAAVILSVALTLASALLIS